MIPLREAELDLLMGRLACGDRAAFDPLYAALRPRAERLARRRVGEAEAADVAQATLLKVFSRASEFTPGRPCLPWFYAVLGHEIQASQRKSARLVLDAAAGEGAACDEQDAEAQLLDRELRRALALALEVLDDEAARVIEATLGDAPRPPVSPATFRKRVSRAYAKLRFLLGGHGAG